MSDYQKYIDALRKCAKEHEYDRTSTGHIIVSNLCRDTADLLEKLSNSENPNKWVLVSERLPEDSQRVNITIQRNYTVYVTTATWDEMRGYFYNLGHAFDDVVAWCELPEPYKADMRGET